MKMRKKKKNFHPHEGPELKSDRNVSGHNKMINSENNFTMEDEILKWIENIIQYNKI